MFKYINKFMEVRKINTREKNIYKSLKLQLTKIAKHNRQGSFKTKERYYEANDRFCKYLAKEYGLQKFTNIKSKHLESYVLDMKERKIATSTIKTDLGGIRFFADKSGNRNVLPDNSKFNLENRQLRGLDRSWSKGEIYLFKELCERRNMHHISCIASLALNEGLRIHETLKIDRAQAEKAIRTGSLDVVGKGGKRRAVPLSNESKDILKERIQTIGRGSKLFLEDEEKTHLKIKQVQNFINRNREHFQDSSRDVNRTFHGLRHTYAQSQYKDALMDGLSFYKARLKVSQLLGHERDEVTRIYLAD